MMYQWRITKYNPKHRDKDGNYLKSEWTSFSDVNKHYATEDKDNFLNNYLMTETAYVTTIILFMKYLDVHFLKVANLEKYNDHENRIKFQEIYSNKMVTLYKKIKDSYCLELFDVIYATRMILREDFWCKLISPKIEIHFGYDYYMYISAIENCTEVIQEIRNLGLYAEEFPSPYNIKIDN